MKRRKHTKQFWQDWELQYLKKHYPDMSTEAVADYLDRTVPSIRNKAFSLKLRKSPEYLKNVQEKWLTAGSQDGIKLEKGYTPWNKGKKGLSIGGKETQFKKGHLPHNAKYNGAIRMNKSGYISIRVSLANWKLLHHHVWEQAGGVIPEGHILTFKDGNKQNCQLENLELISQRGNMIRNSIQRFPKELVGTIKTLSKLKKRIHSYEK